MPEHVTRAGLGTEAISRSKEGWAPRTPEVAQLRGDGPGSFIPTPYSSCFTFRQGPSSPWFSLLKISMRLLSYGGHEGKLFVITHGELSTMLGR